ncbi:MAG: hypothetical protein JNK70_12870 [Phycisphaerae bacterium]|nr:hypothetical protein [Phycisphaerae bacterium]
MPRPSDLFKRTGTGGPSPIQPPLSPFNLSEPSGTMPTGQVGDPDHVTGHRPDKANPGGGGKSGRAQGGAGGSGARPKV